MSIHHEPFGVLPDGRAVTRYTMTNHHGASVSVLDYGAIFTSIVVPDREGKLADVALGFDRLAPYLGGHGSMGDTVGRYGNRIANASFTLDGVTIQLDRNDGVNHLHGGFEGFSRKMWTVATREGADGDSLVMTMTSPDGDQHYPGELRVKLTASWGDDCRLTLHYEAETDKPTLCNLTNHTYFNLAGHDHGTVCDQVLTVDADQVTEVRAGLIPTGRLLDVAGTPFDLRAGRTLGEGLSHTDEDAQMRLAGGYDCNYALRPGEGVRAVARLYSPLTGRAMDVLTDQPGMQVYSGCKADFAGGKGGVHYGRYCGVCLETQHFPDTPNHPEFPGTTVLRPGERYDTTTVYAFGTELNTTEEKEKKA